MRLSISRDVASGTGKPLNAAPINPIDWDQAHVYQYVGTAMVDVDTWPSGDSTVFDDACLPLLDRLENGPGTLEVFPIGIGPYAFEHGDRSVRCMAFETVEGFIVDVLGGFDGTWRILGTDGVAT